MVKRSPRLTLEEEYYSSEDSSGSVSDTSSEIESGDASSDISSSSSDESEVELTFATYNMAQQDYHSIKQFLICSFGHGIEFSKGGNCGTVDITPLARIIVEKLGEYIGTTSKSSEDDDPIGFVTFIPFNVQGFIDLEEEERSCLANLAEMLRDTSKHYKGLGKKAKELIDGALTGGNTALILHERFINLPPQIAAPLYRQLLDDLPNAIEESKSFNPEYILLIVPIYRELESQIDKEYKDEKSRKRVKNDDQEAVDGDTMSSENTEYQYYYAENELLSDLASTWWDFRIKSPHETSDSRRAFGERGIDPARRIFLMTLDSFRTFVDQCQQFLN